MGARSRIGWTDASWNPVTGCTEVSPSDWRDRPTLRSAVLVVAMALGQIVADEGGSR